MLLELPGISKRGISKSPVITSDQGVSGRTTTASKMGSSPFRLESPSYQQGADSSTPNPGRVVSGLTRDSYEVMSLIGHGQYGTVVQLVRSKVDGKHYAMKVVDKYSLVEKLHTGDEKALSRAKAERNVHVDLESNQSQSSHVPSDESRCPYFIKMYHSFQSSRFLYYILEYCPFDVLEYVNLFGPLSEDAAGVFVAELSVAVESLHKRGTVHRDIKTDNILISLSGHVRLADFGLSKKLSSPLSQRCDSVVGFSLSIMPPEFFTEEPYYGAAIDWFQVGICAFEIVTGYSPFQGSPLLSIDSDLYPPEWPTDLYVSPQYKSLVELLLHPDESKRACSLDTIRLMLPGVFWSEIEHQESDSLVPFPQAALSIDADGKIDYSSSGYVVPRLASLEDEIDESDSSGDGGGVGFTDHRDDPLYFKSFTFTRNQ
jgi:serine/threonine protein kinase